MPRQISSASGAFRTPGRPPEPRKFVNRAWRALLSLAVVSILACGAGPPQEGDKAPSFSLPTSNNEQVALDQLLEDRSAVVLVFYRGFF